MATTKKETIAEETIADAPKMVTVRIPRISKDQEDKVVWVNMRRFIIKRGTPVEVPDFVAEVLEHEEEMLQTAFDFESAKRTD
jgi:hypothetical protein